MSIPCAGLKIKCHYKIEVNMQPLEKSVSISI